MNAILFALVNLIFLIVGYLMGMYIDRHKSKVLVDTLFNPFYEDVEAEVPEE